MSTYTDASLIYYPCGIHIFAGWEAAYTAEFCSINPDNPYCIIPEVNDVV